MLTRRLPKRNNRRRSSYSRRARRSDTRRLLDAREQVETAIEDWEGEAEMAWTNYGINRCYSSLEWEEL